MLERREASHRHTAVIGELKAAGGALNGASRLIGDLMVNQPAAGALFDEVEVLEASHASIVAQPGGIGVTPA